MGEGGKAPSGKGLALAIWDLGSSGCEGRSPTLNTTGTKDPRWVERETHPAWKALPGKLETWTRGAVGDGAFSTKDAKGPRWANPGMDPAGKESPEGFAVDVTLPA